MRRAIVLGGGGSRGSYQNGAWKAFREMGLEYDAVVGTSIGSINAAFMAEDSFELNEKLWESITVDKVMQSGINLYTDAEKFFNQKGEIGPFLKLYAQHGGADITPLIDLVTQSIDEEKVRSSKIDMGLVTVRFPTLAPVQIMKKDIPQGRLIDYIISSASLFPAFPVHKFDDNSFIDGGYYDTLPINLALENRADEVVCVDLYSNVVHGDLIGRPWLTYVRPSRPLGSVLLFEKDVLDCNRLLGYLDAKRAFGKVKGVRYSFDPESVSRFDERSRRFTLGIARFEAMYNFQSAFTPMSVRYPLTEVLKRLKPYDALHDYDTDMLLAMETCADLFGIDPYKLYTVPEMDDLIAQKANEKRNVIDIYSISRKGYLSVIDMIASRDRAAIMTCLASLIRNDMLNDKTIRFILRFPDEALGACYMACLPKSMFLAADKAGGND